MGGNGSDGSTNNAAGSGGGGGAYVKNTNVSVSFPVTVSEARIRLIPGNRCELSKGIICADVSEFESYHASQAVPFSIGHRRFTELRATLQRIVPCDAVTG